MIFYHYLGPDNKIYKIYEHPTNYQAHCQDIGNPLFSLDEIKGHIGKDADMIVANEKISLHGRTSIQGRSIAVTNSSSHVLACATIVSTGKNNAYAAAAISNSKIAGKIEFIQQGFGDTTITGQISHSDSTTVVTSNHQWYVLKTIFPSSRMVPQCPETFKSDDIYSPDPLTAGCSESTPEKCRIGDLTAKHASLKLSVGVTGNRKFTVIDGNFPIHGLGDTVQNRLLVITKPNTNNEVLGCAIIKLRGPLRASSHFTAGANKGIEGLVYFKQDSPYHQTKIQVNLTGLAERTKGYHVHMYPIPEQPEDGNPCSQASVGGHLNPWKVDQKDSPYPNKGLSVFKLCHDIVNPLNVRIFTVFGHSLLEDSVLHKEAWVAKLIGTHLSI